MKALPGIDASWTLFLDRDGVINEDNIHGYILNWAEFRFYPGVLEAMKLFSGLFNHILIVTNQRGVGKGLMPLAELDLIHRNMSTAVAETGGRIDGVYYCTAVNNDDPERKPNPGMALRAKERFPSISFQKSIMVGNTSSDMEFGRAIGAYTVYIHTREDKVPADHLVDARFQDLYSFARALSTR